MFEVNQKFSAYPRLSNTKQSWLSMDTKELYAKNNSIEKQRQLLEKYGWIANSFDYVFNSHGFRSDEFVEDSGSVVFLGCSFTLGIGLPYENTFAKIVANQLNLNCYNLGLGGGSHDSCFRFAYYWLEKLKPKIVCMYEPPRERTEVFADNVLHQFYPGILFETENKKFKIKNILDSRLYYKIWLNDKDNNILNVEKNIHAIENICRNLNIKFIKIKNTGKSFIDYARDLVHPGIETNREIADTFLNLI